MQKENILRLKGLFEEAAKEIEGMECWFARDLQSLLGYTEWRNFNKVLQKSKEACKNAGEELTDHFVEVNKTIDMPKGATKTVNDFMLTRYACYLIAQNGDPRKEVIAFAQSYFAIQTRKFELIEHRLKEIERVQAYKELKEAQELLAGEAYERGVDAKGFTEILRQGDEVLFSSPVKELKLKMGIPEDGQIDDYLPKLSLNAKSLATSITDYNVRSKGLEGQGAIGSEHNISNESMRHMLKGRGIQLENLPAEEDISNLQDRIKVTDKRLTKTSKKK